MVALSETTSATKLNGKGRHSGVSVQSYNSIPGTVLRQEPKFQQATGVATRVLQRAPIGYAGGVNLYEYVGGRAVTALDPTGLASEAAYQKCVSQWLDLYAICVASALRSGDLLVLAGCLASLLYGISEICTPPCPCKPCNPPAGTICVSGTGVLPGPRRGQGRPVAFLGIVRLAGHCRCQITTFGNTDPASASPYPPCGSLSGGGTK